jgi:hypothetical protein
MIWRLMASILAMSDTGSVSVVVSHTDWATEQQCAEIIGSHYQSPPPREFNGHTVTVKISASCVPVFGGADGLPPPIAEILPRIFPGAPAPPAPPPPQRFYR